jgi:hypothetical protein
VLLLFAAVYLPSSFVLVCNRRLDPARAWVEALSLFLLMSAARVIALLAASALFIGAARFGPLCCCSSCSTAMSLQEHTPCAK